jgi:hypothetical protein
VINVLASKLSMVAYVMVTVCADHFSTARMLSSIQSAM